MERSEALPTDSNIGAGQSTPDADSEKALVARVRMGDEAAWTKLVQQHQQPVFRLAYLLLGSGQDTASQAEDVAQETFMRAFTRLEQFKSDRPLRPWLLGIAANLARNRRRSIGRYWAVMQRWWQEQSGERAATVMTEDELDNAQLLWQAVQQLSARHQQVLYLRYFLDVTEMEMADILKIAAGTVKSRLYRARQALHTILRNEYPALYAEWQQE